MRNGIYRLWFHGPHGTFGGAVMARGNDLVAVDKDFAYNGTYRETGDWVRAELSAIRLNHENIPLNLPDVDAMTLIIEGNVLGESARLIGHVAGFEEVKIAIDCTFLCEA